MRPEARRRPTPWATMPSPTHGPAPMITVHHLEQLALAARALAARGARRPYEIKRYQRDAKTMLAPPELRAVHPLGKSPVITDGDVTVAESGAIIEYLVERYGDGRLVPAGRHARAAALHLLAALRRRLGDAAAAAEAGLRQGREARRCRSSSSRSRAASPPRCWTTFVDAQPEAPARLHGSRAERSASGSPATSSAPPTSR